MKINVEIDCTPEEARRVMGLPDLTPVHDHYIQLMLGSMDKGMINPEMIQSIMKSWAPMGEAGMNLWRGMFENMTKGRSAE